MSSSPYPNLNVGGPSGPQTKFGASASYREERGLYVLKRLNFAPTLLSRGVASLATLGDQKRNLSSFSPHFPITFSNSSSFFIIFFLNWVLQVGGSPTLKALATQMFLSKIVAYQEDAVFHIIW